MLLTIYLIGVIIAVYLVGKAIRNHPENNIEFNGFIIGYCFALFSWITVVVLLLIKGEKYIRKIYDKT